MSVTNVSITSPWDEATVSAGAEISSKGAFQSLDQRLIFEDFTGPSVNASLVTLLSGTGSLTQAQPTGLYKHRMPANNDQAGFYCNSVLDETATDFRIKVILRYFQISTGNHRFFNYGLETTVPGLAIDTLRFYVVYRSLATMSLTYLDDVGADFAWDSTSWNANGSVVFGFPPSSELILYLISNTTSWKYRVEDNEGNLIQETDSVLWANTLGQGGKNPYFMIFQQGSSAQTVSYDTSKIEIWLNEDGDNFLTAAQTCQRDIILTNESFNSEDIILTLGRTPLVPAEIKVAVSPDGGAFGSFINVDVTPIAGESGRFRLASGTAFNTHSTSVTLKVQINSPDTDTQLQVFAAEIEGITVAGGGSQAPIADVRNGIIYNDGALTGTAFIPAKSDTRKDTPVDDGVGTLAVAPPSDVRDDVPTDATTGTAAIPGADDVRENVPTDDTVGNYVPALEDRHALGDSYGSNGTEFTGTKALASFNLPVEVIIEDSEILVFEGCE